MYEGDRKNVEHYGHGTYIWANGDNYIGEWKDGDMHGQGTFTLPDEKKYVGVWKNAEPWNGIRYDKNGNIEGNFVNGVYSNCSGTGLEHILAGIISRWPQYLFQSYNL